MVGLMSFWEWFVIDDFCCLNQDLQDFRMYRMRINDEDGIFDDSVNPKPDLYADTDSHYNI